ncbi:outer membrane protein [Aureimonas psammosilenae]|uniref:outer membrane protein n=1 Tax=Aureimonas psammosilenae TaxID=2495496 RepID=UPI001261284B|nr:outer membrane beta-barrel protein [Aureimonas psammosilenae]
MKRFAILLAATALATPAFAADIITEEPPAPAPVEIAPAYNFTSLYIGGQAGVAFGGSSGAIGSDLLGIPGVTSFQDSPDVGFTGGGHIGYDYQFANGLLLGGVVDFNYIDHDRSVGATFPGGETSVGVDMNYFGTARAKLGYAMDRVAVYGTGGVAYGDYDLEVRNGDVLSALGTGFGSTTDTDKDKVGYTVGAGVDYLATQNLSFGLEYLYTDLGSAKTTTTFASPALGTSFDVDTKTDVDFHTVMAKASYRFN